MRLSALFYLSNEVKIPTCMLKVLGVQLKSS